MNYAKSEENAEKRVAELIDLRREVARLQAEVAKLEAEAAEGRAIKARLEKARIFWQKGLDKSQEMVAATSDSREKFVIEDGVQKTCQAWVNFIKEMLGEEAGEETAAEPKTAEKIVADFKKRFPDNENPPTLTTMIEWIILKSGGELAQESIEALAIHIFAKAAEKFTKDFHAAVLSGLESEPKPSEP